MFSVKKSQLENSPNTFADVVTQRLQAQRKQILAAKVEDKMYDLSDNLPNSNEDLNFITFDDVEGKLLFWHSSAHTLAQALRRLYPEVKFDDGPALFQGPGHFYYDVYLEEKITEDDFAKIEVEIEKVIQENLPVSSRILEQEEAIKHFGDLGETFKLDIIKKLPKGTPISLYKQGDFEDMCRGPHVASTGVLGNFKLTAVSGAYWKGDVNNPMLQRIYGVSFPQKKQLKEYLFKIEEAKKRDHRKLGKELSLFHSQAEAPGMIFWHQKGYSLYRTVENYVRQLMEKNDYQEVKSPQVLDLSLWEKSGHADKFAENMFLTKSEDRTFAVKPMNCPCHVQIFNQGLKSYRDLPLRMAEFGSCHRNEPSGTLHGLMRVRNFVQDDAHIFCTEEMIQDEVSTFTDLLFEAYKDFGFTDVIIKLSTRPENRVGDDKVWDKAEKALEDALNFKKLDWELQPGEGAFYGPKIEFSLKDCLDRVWQCGTIQVDFSTPTRLDASYVNSQGDKVAPVMLHRAILGSIERFVGILIEHYAGKFPLWLSPSQVKVLTVSDEQKEYAQEIVGKLKAQGFYADLDIRNEKIGYKVREWNSEKVNYAIILGAQEMESKNISFRARGERETTSLTLDGFIQKLAKEIEEKGFIKT